MTKPNKVSVQQMMDSVQYVEGGWKEARCPRCGWTMDAPNKNELLMAVVRHVDGCMRGD